MTKKFLVIDDDDTFARVLTRSLHRKGYPACSANDSETALSLLCNQTGDHAISHIILDLKLAETSGLQLLPQLLAINSHIQVVVLTGYASVATTVEAMKKGAINYLSKPATAEEILAAFGSGQDSTDIACHTEERPEDSGEDGPLSVQRVEWEYIQRHLVANGNNISATARALGMHRRTLQRKLQKRPGKL